MTVTVALTAPNVLLAVKMNVVDWAGDTDREVAALTSPTPLSMVTEVAPDALHLSTAVCPAVIEEGDAVKDVIDGACPGGGTGEESCQLTCAEGEPVCS